MEVTLALAQYPITFHHSLEDWKSHTENWVAGACSQGAQILTFPEYGSMELTSLFPEAVRNDLKLQIDRMQELLPYFIDFFRELAEKYRCVLVAPSFPVDLGDKTVNRCFVFTETGYSFQDKHFMTRFEDESWGISSSDGALRLFDTRFGKFGVQICFDIEFPIGGHLLAEAGADFILVPSCTETLKGATRVHIGARARAMEQQLYTGVSQTIDEALWSPAVDINYGYTAFYSSPDGDFDDEGILAKEQAQTSGWLIRTLDLSKNAEIRENGQVLNFRNSQNLTMQDGNCFVEIVSMKQNGNENQNQNQNEEMKSSLNLL
ncbi:carbon-nitrogen hydrolase family protein [Fluviicola sp.]|uniref:carbon-nitrogen hydrolase family protein n=1 Tax=Fluviicola sp. TaxID=1917219 RepID=UPI0031D4F458